ncbi:helix-turn-helix transcriptional regulator [Nostoc favosum]|uniref:Sigma-70 region 4 domain-containing protein n=1 Tax=Nostoc favosum CHAB5714 TaxID=2780399 RepID=A0ABS8IEF4_9NOSO|nr:sigma-70 region 4 domain-containing protein [Nostoc favosum]MCC5602144.1 sigma-70 region 4 domain-containing protein [Nostoc favosum CHAB5714]
MTGTQQEIMDLRALNLTPKQIARKLGMKVSSVNAAIQNQAQQTTLDKKESEDRIQNSENSTHKGIQF